MGRVETLSDEQVLKLREEVEQTLKKVEAEGRQERELVTQVIKELTTQFLGAWRGK